MSVERKRQFVDTAYRILKEEGVGEIKIRRIADELKCTSTVVYRYFENVNHLIALASIRFLNDYFADFKRITGDPKGMSHPYEMNLEIWDCLAHHAMKNIAVYENLFFGQYKEELGEIIFEYYQLYLDSDEQTFDGYTTSILFNDDLEQRDLVLLRRAAAAGEISMKDTEVLSKLETYLFHGVLLKYMGEDHKLGTAEKAYQEFYEVLHNLADKYRQKK